MERGSGASIMEYFGDLEDPRIERCKRHQLLDIITIGAVICGADSWVHVEMFGKIKEEWFRTFLELGNGIPSHDTFGDVFSRLDPDGFQECFMEWSQGWPLLPGFRWWPSTLARRSPLSEKGRAGRPFIWSD